MCHALIKLGLTYHASRLCAVLLLLVGNAVHAQTAEGDEPGSWSYQYGADAWRLNPSQKIDSLPNFVEENSNLLLPNSHSKWQYSEVSAWGRLIGSKQLANDLLVSTKVRADQTLGLRVDEAQIEKHFSPSLGIRAGVVDYKTSWCRVYENDNGWMREIEAICNTPQFRDVTGGAPGAQIFTNLTWGDHYKLQSQVGIYRPLLLNFAPKEFGNLTPSTNYQVQKNNKTGVNFNLLNLYTGLEARLSYIHANQMAYEPERDLSGTEKMVSDLVYMAISTPISKQLNFRITHLQQYQKATCRSTMATIGSACNLNLNFDKESTAIELAYRWQNLHLFSLGLNRTNLDLQQVFFTPSLDVYHQSNLTYTKSMQLSVAWRKDWEDGWFSVVQFMQSAHQSSYDIYTYQARGTALGVRLGYTY